MKMRKTIVVLSVMIVFGVNFHTNSIAQISEAKLKPADFTKNKLLFSPLNLFDFITPSLQVGYSRKIAGENWVQGEIGWITKRSAIGYLLHNEYWYTYSGFKLRSEYKHSLNHRFNTSKNLIYFSTELFYTQRTAHVNDLIVVADTSFQYSFGKADTTNMGYEDFFSTEMKKVGFNLKIGSEVGFNDWWYTEFYIGIGLSFRMLENRNRENPTDSFYDGIWMNPNVPGNRIRLTLPLNFKIGRRF